MMKYHRVYGVLYLHAYNYTIHGKLNIHIISNSKLNKNVMHMHIIVPIQMHVAF